MALKVAGSGWGRTALGSRERHGFACLFIFSFAPKDQLSIYTCWWKGVSGDRKTTPDSQWSGQGLRALSICSYSQLGFFTARGHKANQQEKRCTGKSARHGERHGRLQRRLGKVAQAQGTSESQPVGLGEVGQAFLEASSIQPADTNERRKTAEFVQALGSM